MLDAILVRSIDECVYAVVDILLDRVVDRALTRRRACSVVVYAQTAATVNKVDVVAHLVQLYVEVGSLAQCSLNASYLGYLRSDMEVDESHAVVQTLLVESFECLEQFRRTQSELRSVATALLPFARSA